MNVNEALNKFRRKMLCAGFRNVTINNYTSAVKSFCEFAMSNQHESHEEYLEAYMVGMRAMKRTPKTINLNRAAVCKFFEFVYGLKISTKDVPRMKQPRSLPEYFTSEQIAAMISKTDNRKHQLVLRLLYSTGLRLGEIVNLRVENLLYADRPVIRLRDGKGGKDRYIMLPGGLAKDLLQYCEGRSAKDYVIPGQGCSGKICHRTIAKICQHAATRAGVSGRIHPHKFRHSYATHTLQNGGNLRVLQEALGHGNIKTTEIYTHVAVEDLCNMPDLDRAVQR